MPNGLDLLTKSEDGSFKPKTDKGVVALFVGESGTGKDNAVASFPKPLYVFDIDHRIKGMMSSIAWLGPEELSKIDYDQYSMTAGFKKIDEKLELFLTQAKQRNLKYKTLYFASISSLGQMLVLESRTVRGMGKGQVRAGVPLVDFQDAKYAATAFRIMQFEFLMPMQELGINIICSGHVVPKWGKGEAPEGGLAEPKVVGEKLLGVSDQFSEEIPGYFDEVYRFKKEANVIGDMQHIVEFSGHLAKTSFPIVGKKLDVTGKSFYPEWKALVESNSFIGKKG